MYILTELEQQLQDKEYDLRNLKSSRLAAPLRQKIKSLSSLVLLLYNLVRFAGCFFESLNLGYLGSLSLIWLFPSVLPNPEVTETSFPQQVVLLKQAFLCTHQKPSSSVAYETYFLPVLFAFLNICAEYNMMWAHGMLIFFWCLKTEFKMIVLIVSFHLLEEVLAFHEKVSCSFLPQGHSWTKIFLTRKGRRQNCCEATSFYYAIASIAGIRHRLSEKKINK